MELVSLILFVILAIAWLSFFTDPPDDNLR